MDYTFNIIPVTSSYHVHARHFYNDKAWRAQLEIQANRDGEVLTDEDVWAFAEAAAEDWNAVVV